MRLLGHDLHILTGAYALDALEAGPERDQFEFHLRRCQSCATEVRGLREVATGLAFAAALRPPPDLRGRVLAAAASTRQLAPVIEHHARPSSRSSWAPRLAAAAAVAVFAAAVVLGVAQVSVQRQLGQARAQNQAIAAVLAAPDARILVQATSAGGTATVVVSRAEREMIVTTAGLPALPATKVYELWLMGAPRTRPAGLLPAARAGRTQPLLASGLVPGDKLGLTVEPAGGTARPTTTPILVMSLPA